MRSSARSKLRGWRRIAWLVVLSCIALNGVAWMQARSLTHYVPDAAPLPTAETMSVLARVKVVALGVAVPRPKNTRTPGDVGFAFEVATIPLAAGAQLEAWFVPHPRARGMVALFPGYAASKESLLAPAQAFHALGFATLLVDFQGAGGSSGTDTTLGVREAGDVVAAAAYATAHWPGLPLVLYGMSLGSTAIMRAVAVDGIAPAALILESPFDRLLTTTRHRFAALGLPSFPAADLLLVWGGQQQGFNAFDHNPVDYATQIAVPTLLLHGADDPRVTLAETRGIYERLAGPKTLLDVPGAGHELLIGAAADVWTHAVAEFLGTLAWGR